MSEKIDNIVIRKFNNNFEKSSKFIKDSLIVYSEENEANEFFELMKNGYKEMSKINLELSYYANSSQKSLKYKFDNINDAPDVWTWEVVKKGLENYELTKDEIQNKATELFGNQFKKQFPQEGTEYMQYDEKLGKYISTGIELDTLEDCFYIKNIKKTKDGYEVEIAEYLEDYVNSLGIEDENEIYEIYIKNLNEETIANVKKTEGETKIIEVVKENLDKFTTKTVNLKKNSNGNIYVESVK